MRKPFILTCPRCNRWFKVKGDPNDKTFDLKTVPLNYSIGGRCPRCKGVYSEPVLKNGRPTKLFFEVYTNGMYQNLGEKGLLK